jgi:hypothetical protein
LCLLQCSFCEIGAAGERSLKYDRRKSRINIPDNFCCNRTLSDSHHNA